jgi:hypothetical protein
MTTNGCGGPFTTVLSATPRDGKASSADLGHLINYVLDNI